jgi:hypothetical protein
MIDNLLNLDKKDEEQKQKKKEQEEEQQQDKRLFDVEPDSMGFTYPHER